MACTNHHQERLARSSLIAEGFEVYLPFYARANHKGEIYATPLFPGYVFVKMATGMQGWTKVFAARGVSSVLGIGGKPRPVPRAIIRAVKDREFDGFVRMGMGPAARRFEAGQAVKLNKGGKADPLDAIFVEQLDKKRCLVLIDFLGDKRFAEAALAHIA